MLSNGSTAPITKRGASNKNHIYNDRSLHLGAVSQSLKDLSFLLETSIVLTHLSNISRLLILPRQLKRIGDQYPPTLPLTAVDDFHRKLAWTIARAEQTRDPLLRELPDKEKLNKPDEAMQIFKMLVLTLVAPKRQQSIFVKDEELKRMLEDRVGTPHVSELQYDEDMTAELCAEELALVGAVDMLIAKEKCEEEAEAARRIIPL
jgi:hypothetical protein